MILCPHIINGSTDALRLVRSGARAVKLINCYDKAMEFRASGAQLVIARAVVPDDTWRRRSPDAFYEAVIRPHQTHPANRGINGWETLNEDHRNLPGSETPDYHDIARRALYEAELARLIHANGHRPVVGNWAVGNPSGTRAEQAAAWRAYQPALDAAARYSGWVGLHLYYSIPGWEHPLETLIAHIAGMFPRPGILVTECGREPGYRSEGYDPARYADELIAWARQVARNYPQVQAAFIFTFGSDDTWRNYDVQGDEPFVSRVVAAYQSTPTPPAPPTPQQPAPAPPGDDATHVVIAGVLNVRLYPWCGDSVPPVVRQLVAGQRVRVYDTVLFPPMSVAWGLISRNGKEWVSMRYLRALS